MSCVTVGIFAVLSATIYATATTTPALFLSPYIFQNRTEEARNLSKVDPSLFLNVVSYSGFLTLEESYQSNTFFWYFPVADKPVNETPWIIWLQGGPGASSLDGLFLEMGPFEFDKELKLREWSWCKEYSMVFLDNPVGAGFSFTNSEDGFVHDMDTYAEHLNHALQQLVRLFPELGVAPLYIAGESYAGRYVPAFAAKILSTADKIGNAPVNLQGLIMGNPVMNREHVANFTAMFYNWGLIDSLGARAVRPLQDAYFKAIRDGDAQKAIDMFDSLLTKLQDMTSQDQLYNILGDDYNFHVFESFLAREAVREAIHVGDITFTFSNDTVQRRLIPDFLSDVETKVEALLEHCRILIYCGQLDLTAPCVPNAQARRAWRWSRREEFLKAPRQPWAYNGTVAGYVKSGGGFTEALVRGAGHLVPIERPAQAQQLVSYFIRGLDMPVPSNWRPEIEDYDLSTPEIADVTTVNNVMEKSTEPTTETVVKPLTKAATVSSAMVASVSINVILVLIVILGLAYYIRRRRRNRNVFYNTVDNLSDEIFLS